VCSVDDGGKLREELKDFIDDAPTEESDGEDSDVSKQSKTENSDDDFDDRLDDEDYDLIEENLGVKVQRVSFT
jgi:transcription elongation factor SPT6